MLPWTPVAKPTRGYGFWARINSDLNRRFGGDVLHGAADVTNGRKRIKNAEKKEPGGKKNTGEKQKG